MIRHTHYVIFCSLEKQIVLMCGKQNENWLVSDSKDYLWVSRITIANISEIVEKIYINLYFLQGDFD